MPKYPRKCWCGQLIEAEWEEGYHDCNQWEYIVAEGEKKDEC